MDAQPLRGELIVADNNSTDRTAEIARTHGARVAFESHNQISRARNAGARIARGRYIVFLDADTELSAELLGKALEHLESDTCVGGGVRVLFDAPTGPVVEKLLQAWNWFAPKFHIAAGCFVFCRRDAFEAVGGFSERVYASEEVWFSRSISKWGKRRNLGFIVIDEPRIETSNRKLDWYSKRQLLWYTILILIPFAVFSKRLCNYWYRKPATEQDKTTSPLQ